ncbi:solute carrier family 41 member 1-like [Bombyx mandarina]|uniref:Solute carrier family 41 member 1-like n=1 Tax=Bombyx mandarina TaxID=7092 RepID=A0A6J2KJL3_BOMMA|nr:solute carrier family 41 member 1-like [Bombyx mandarina]
MPIVTKEPRIKKEIKKIAKMERADSLKTIYEQLETNESQKCIYKLAKQCYRSTRIPLDVGLLKKQKKEEKLWTTLMQVAVPFFIAGCGTIGAGLVLGKVRDWDVFINISAIFVLVPSLSGLKGNLDMCLASRLSTQANLGNMDSTKEVISMVVGNISLVQVQAIVAATVVSIFAIVVNTITDRAIFGPYVLLLVACAVFTATTTCFVLGKLIAWAML